MFTPLPLRRAYSFIGSQHHSPLGANNILCVFAPLRENSFCSKHYTHTIHTPCSHSPFRFSAFRLFSFPAFCHYGKEQYVCGLENRHMDSDLTNEKKDNKGMHWMITIVSLVACVGLIIVAPEWFWVTLPFLLTSFVKAIDMI